MAGDAGPAIDGAPTERAGVAGSAAEAIARSRQRVAAIERTAGIGPELAVALADLAVAESVGGDIVTATLTIDRATAVLGGAGDVPFARFAVVLARARVQAADGRPQDAMATCQRLLMDKAALKAAPVEFRTSNYQLILALAGDLLRPPWESPVAMTRGNRAAASMVDDERTTYGRLSPERIPGLMDAADWYSLTAQISRGRAVLVEVIEVATDAYGARDARLAEPLLALGNTYLDEGKKPDEARQAFMRGLGLAYPADAESARYRASLHAALGDADVQFDAPGAGAAHYAAAWRELAGHPEWGPGGADAVFAAPVPLYLPVVPSPKVAVSNDLRGWVRPGPGPGTLSFIFTVRPDGRIDDLRLESWDGVAGAVPDRSTSAAQMGRARWRPRVAGGVPVAAEGQRQVVEWR
jgi:hypothetical protein